MMVEVATSRSHACLDEGSAPAPMEAFFENLSAGQIEYTWPEAWQ